MPFAAAVSEHPLPTHAVGEAIGSILERVGYAPDLVVLFVTGPFGGAMEDMTDTVRRTLSPSTLVGAAAETLLVGAGEVGRSGAVVLFAATWEGRMRTGARGLRPVVFEADHDGEAWRVSGSDRLREERGTLMLIGADGSFPLVPFVGGLSARSPDLQIVGGSTPPPRQLSADRLVVDDRVLRRGAVGVFLPPGSPVRAISSQGFRALGATYIVTGVDEGGITEIAGRPALEHVLDTASALDLADRGAMAKGVHLAVVGEEPGAAPGEEELLVRRVLGADRARGLVAVDGPVPLGSPVRIGVRDARGATTDLRAALSGVAADGALVFGDHGRAIAGGAGEGDVEIISDHVDPRAIAGMSCASEVGPLAGAPRVQDGSITLLLFDERDVAGAHPPPDGWAPGTVSPRRDPG